MKSEEKCFSKPLEIENLEEHKRNIQILKLSNKLFFTLKHIPLQEAEELLQKYINNISRIPNDPKDAALIAASSVYAETELQKLSSKCHAMRMIFYQKLGMLPKQDHITHLSNIIRELDNIKKCCDLKI